MRIRAFALRPVEPVDPYLPIAQRQRGHGIPRMLSGDGYVQDSALLILGSQGCITLLLHTSSRQPKALTFPASSTRTLSAKCWNLIQKLADVQHRDIDFARQTLQIGQ